MQRRSFVGLCTAFVLSPFYKLFGYKKDSFDVMSVFKWKILTWDRYAKQYYFTLNEEEAKKVLNNVKWRLVPYKGYRWAGDLQTSEIYFNNQWVELGRIDGCGEVASFPLLEKSQNPIEYYLEKMWLGAMVYIKYQPHISKSLTFDAFLVIDSLTDG